MGIKSLSERIADSFVKGGADPKLRQVYAYGIEGTLSTGIILLLLLTAGLVFGKLLHMLIFIVAWLPLRVMVGGMHAKTHLMCTIVSVSLGVLSISFSEQINRLPFIAVTITTVLCYIVFFLLSPVVHKNHPISESHRKKMRTIARVYAFVECSGIIWLAYAKSSMMSPVLLACFSTAVMELLGYFNKNTIKHYD